MHEELILVHEAVAVEFPMEQVVLDKHLSESTSFSFIRASISGRSPDSDVAFDAHALVEQKAFVPPAKRGSTKQRQSYNEVYKMNEKLKRKQT